MTTPTPLETIVARAVAKANMIMSMGEQGVMAMNPKMLDQLFEQNWGMNSPQHDAMRQYAYFVALAVLKTLDMNNVKPSAESVARPVIDLSEGSDAQSR